MDTIIENLVKQTVAVVLAALVTVVIANSIGQLAATDLTGKRFDAYAYGAQQGAKLAPSVG